MTFKGKDLLDTLQSDRFNDRKSKTVTPVTCSNENEATKLATRLLAAHVFVRLRYSHESKDRGLYNKKAVYEHDKQTIEPNGTYFWVLEPSKTRFYVYGTLVLFCLFFNRVLVKNALSMWLSVAYLVTFTSIIALRLALYAILFTVGFRGVWLFPNLMDDDAGILGAFTPIIAQDKKYWKKPKPKTVDPAQSPEAKAAEEAKAAKEAAEEKERKKKEKEPGYGWEFGLLNMGLLVLVGATISYQFGLFDPELIPGFVLSQEELWSQWPALAPPNFTHPTQFTHRREDADSETSSADGDSVGSSPEEDGAERPSDSMKHEPRYRSAAVQAELDADVDNPEDAVDV